MSVYTETDSPPENQPDVAASEDASSESPAQSSTPLEGEALENALRHQLEWYFSKQNLANDAHLVSRMNSQGFVSIDVIADFRRVKSLTTDRNLLLKVMRTCASIALDDTGTLVKPNIKMERTTLILRDIASSTPVDDVKKIFESEQCPKLVNIRADVGDTWFVTFENQDACLEACQFLQSQTFQGKPISCRIKSENLLRGFYYQGNPTSPVDNNRPTSNGFYGVPPYMNYNPYLPNRQQQYNQQWQNHNAYKASSSKTSTESQSPTSEYKGGGRGRKSTKKRTDRSEEDGSSPVAEPHFPSVTTPIPMSASQATRTSRKKDKSSPDKSSTRRATEGGTTQPQIASSQHFPPLPKKKAGAGYVSTYQKYDRDQMAEIISRLNQEGFSRPSTYPPSDKCVIIRSDPLMSCQLLEPFPVMYPASPSPLLAAQPNHSNMPYFDLNALTYFELPPASVPPETPTGVPDLSLGPSQQTQTVSAASAETVAPQQPPVSEEQKPKPKKTRSRAASGVEEKSVSVAPAKEITEDNASGASSAAKPVSFAGAVGVAEKKEDSAQSKSRAPKAASKQTKQQPAPAAKGGRTKQGKSRENSKSAVQQPSQSPTSDKSTSKSASKPAKSGPKQPKAARTSPPASQETSPPVARSAWTAAAAAPPKPKPAKSDKPASPTPPSQSTSAAAGSSSSSSSSSGASAPPRKSKSDSKPAESKPDSSASTSGSSSSSSSSGKFSWADMAKKADKGPSDNKSSPPASTTASPAKKTRSDKRQ